jgi:hypothetical protein
MLVITLTEIDLWLLTMSDCEQGTVWEVGIGVTSRVFAAMIAL